MKIFYSSLSHPPVGLGGKLFSWFFLFLFIFLFGGGIYGLFWLLRLIFAKSFLLGILFIFFGFPLIARFLFFIFLVLVPFLLAGLFMTLKKQENTKASEDVVDVKYKIID